MEKIKLTKRAVEAIEPPAAGEIVVWDAELKGFGVRIASSGRRTYFVYGRTTGGRQVKFKVGVHGAVTAIKAREIASVELGKLAAGQDPTKERQDAKTAERKRLGAPTMRDLADRYMSDHAELHKRTAGDDRASLDKIVLPRFGSRKVAEITSADIEALHRDMRGTPPRANRIAALLSKMFTLAMKWGLRPDNPVKGLERYQEHRRERYLRPDEIARLGAVLAEHPNRAGADAVRLLLLTGARRGEVLGAQWADFDLEAGVWTKPGATTKRKTEHRVPLSPAAVALLTGIKAAADERSRKARAAGRLAKSSPFVFPGKDGDGHLTDIKRFWQTVCGAADLAERVPRKLRNGKAALTKNGKPKMLWRPTVRAHDLRHTYASLLASAGLSLPIIGALLGHTQPATTQRYAHLMDDPLRQATTAAAAKIDEYAKATRKGRLIAVKP
jgi:integrase